MASRVSNDKLLRREEVLALDIATHCGYYCLHESGTWNFTESLRRNGNKMHKDFRDTLLDFIIRHRIRMIVAEDVNVMGHFYDMRRLSELRGILFEVCDALDLPQPEFVNVSTLKKWATGNGRADKAMMIQACIDHYHYTPPDDNAADACHLFHYYIRKHRI